MLITRETISMKCGSSRVGRRKKAGRKFADYGYAANQHLCQRTLQWAKNLPHISMFPAVIYIIYCDNEAKIWKGEKGKRDRTKHLTFSGITTIRDIHSVGSVWLFISASSEHCRGVVDTCVLSDNWSEGRGDTAWPTRRQRRWQRQRQRQRHRYITLTTVFMTLTMSTKTTELGAYK